MDEVSHNMCSRQADDCESLISGRFMMIGPKVDFQPVSEFDVDGAKARRCRLTVSKRVLNPPMLSTLEASN